MSYEGNVADLDLIGRLVDLSREHFTGAIRFENDGIIKIIYFKDGDILSASTNDRTDSIDEMLVRSGKITREHLKQALGKRKENETLGDALLNLGFITRKELTWARRVQVLGIIRSILAWTAGNYAVVSDYLPKREEGTIFPLPQIVIELIVTEADRGRFERLLDSGNATFEREGDFDTRFRQLGLNQDAEEIAAQIDGSRSAAEVAATTGKDAFNVYKLLHALELLGMLHRVDRSPRPAPAPVATGAVAAVASATDVPLPAESIPPADETSQSWESGPTGPSDAFEASENAPSLSTVISGGEPLLMRELDSSPPASDELIHDPYDADAVRSQVEENLGGDHPLEEPRRRGFTTSILAILLIAILGAAGYIYWKRSHEPVDRAVYTPPAGSQPARSAGDGAYAPLPPTTTAPEGGAGDGTTSLTTEPYGQARTESALAGGRATNPLVPAAVGTGVKPDASTSKTTSAVKPPVKSAAHESNPASTAGRAGGISAGRRPSDPPSAQNVTKLQPATATSGARITNIGSQTGGPDKGTARTAPAGTLAPAASSANDPLRARYDGMAERSARDAAANQPYAVQIELVCRTESVTRALAAGGNDVWFVPTSFRGQKCFRVFWGHFSSAAAARQAIANVPTSLAGGSTPTVVHVP